MPWKTEGNLKLMWVGKVGIRILEWKMAGSFSKRPEEWVVKEKLPFIFSYSGRS